MNDSKNKNHPSTITHTQKGMDEGALQGEAGVDQEEIKKINRIDEALKDSEGMVDRQVSTWKSWMPDVKEREVNPKGKEILVMAMINKDWGVIEKEWIRRAVGRKSWGQKNQEAAMVWQWNEWFFREWMVHAKKEVEANFQGNQEARQGVENGPHQSSKEQEDWLKMWGLFLKWGASPGEKGWGKGEWNRVLDDEDWTLEGPQTQEGWELALEFLNAWDQKVLDWTENTYALTKSHPDKDKAQSIRKMWVQATQEWRKKVVENNPQVQVQIKSLRQIIGAWTIQEGSEVRYGPWWDASWEQVKELNKSKMDWIQMAMPDKLKNLSYEEWKNLIFKKEFMVQNQNNLLWRHLLEELEGVNIKRNTGHKDKEEAGMDWGRVQWMEVGFEKYVQTPQSQWKDHAHWMWWALMKDDLKSWRKILSHLIDEHEVRIKSDPLTLIASNAKDSKMACAWSFNGNQARYIGNGERGVRPWVEAVVLKDRWSTDSSYHVQWSRKQVEAWNKLHENETVNHPVHWMEFALALGATKILESMEKNPAWMEGAKKWKGWRPHAWKSWSDMLRVQAWKGEPWTMEDRKVWVSQWIKSYESLSEWKKGRTYLEEYIKDHPQFFDQDFESLIQAQSTVYGSARQKIEDNMNEWKAKSVSHWLKKDLEAGSDNVKKSIRL